jgi:hypothetical protein
VIPFTIPAKDQTILKIDKRALHEQKTAQGENRRGRREPASLTPALPVQLSGG